MAAPDRGSVWLIDLAYIAKVVSHTTSVRATRFEVAIPASFPKQGAFDAQSLATIPTPKLIRKLGDLTVDRLQQVEDAVRDWLGL